jgi:hypothetical protein
MDSTGQIYPRYRSVTLAYASVACNSHIWGGVPDVWRPFWKLDKKLDIHIYLPVDWCLFSVCGHYNVEFDYMHGVWRWIWGLSSGPLWPYWWARSWWIWRISLLSPVWTFVYVFRRHLCMCFSYNQACLLCYTLSIKSSSSFVGHYRYKDKGNEWI